MDLVRDVLDNQLVDNGHNPMGRVDDLLIVLRDGHPPCVVAIESGLPALARRVNPKLQGLARRVGRWFGVRRGRVYRIRWRHVKHVGLDVELDLSAEQTPATAWERFLRRHVVRHIPGSGQ